MNLRESLYFDSYDILFISMIKNTFIFSIMTSASKNTLGVLLFITKMKMMRNGLIHSQNHVIIVPQIIFEPSALSASPDQTL